MGRMSRPVQRVVVLTLGWFFIALGIVGLVLPVLQGVLFILIGLYLLSRESRIARRWFDWLRRRFPALDMKLSSFIERLRSFERR